MLYSSASSLSALSGGRCRSAGRSRSAPKAVLALSRLMAWRASWLVMGGSGHSWMCSTMRWKHSCKPMLVTPSGAQSRLQ
eukprot:5789620-Pyramimonas_sp.AAC.2